MPIPHDEDDDFVIKRPEGWEAVLMHGCVLGNSMDRRHDAEWNDLLGWFPDLKARLEYNDRVRVHSTFRVDTFEGGGGIGFARYLVVGGRQRNVQDFAREWRPLLERWQWIFNARIFDYARYGGFANLSAKFPAMGWYGAPWHAYLDGPKQDRRVMKANWRAELHERFPHSRAFQDGPLEELYPLCQRLADITRRPFVTLNDPPHGHWLFTEDENQMVAARLLGLV